MSKEFYSEIYDTKTQNVKVRPVHGVGHCDECGKFAGHKTTCSKVTFDDLIRLILQSQKTEEAMRKKAARWLEHLQRATGKIAILKHENNKLRKENEMSEEKPKYNVDRAAKMSQLENERLRRG